MNSKNTKYKWDAEPLKTTNSGIFKEPYKMKNPYSPKNLPKDSPKNFKQNYIRHASEEEFKRITQSTTASSELGSAEEEYHAISVSHGRLQYMEPKKPVLTTPQEHPPHRNFYK